MSIARVTKQRDLEIEGQFGFGLVPVELGLNGRGKPVTSCIVEARDVSDIKKKKRRPIGKVQRLILAELGNVLASEVSQRWKIFNGPVVKAVDERAWRDMAFRKMSGEPKDKHRSFGRAVDALVADEFIYRDGDMVWVV